MEGSECSRKPLYCHWDSHEHDVLFMNENELDQHIYSHFSSFPEVTQRQFMPPAAEYTEKTPEVPIKTETDEKTQQTVECHWDACHELFDIDEIMEHFRSSHMDVSKHPHDANCMRDVKHCNTDPTPNVDYSISGKESNGSMQFPMSTPGGATYYNYQINNEVSPSSMESSHLSNESDFSSSTCDTFPRRNNCDNPQMASQGGFYQMQNVTMPMNFDQNNQIPTTSENSHNINENNYSTIPTQVNLDTTSPKVIVNPKYKEKSWPKFDISSLPTLKSRDPSSMSEMTNSEHVCMWLTSNGVCGQQFFTSNELNAHIVHKHLEEGPSICKWDGCKRENVPFNHRQKVIRHIQVHARTTDHKCSICERHMSSDALLKTHELRHLNEWPFKCTICDRSFRTKNSLSVHIRTHTGDKPLMCTFPGCGKRFAESSNLAKHRRIHMAPQFMCPVCNRMFTRKDHLRRHMRTKDHFEKPVGDVNERPSDLNQVPSTALEATGSR